MAATKSGTQNKTATAKSVKEPTCKKNIRDELCRLSKKDLAQPTNYETRTRAKKGKVEEKEGEKSEAVTPPKLRDFGSFVFESPTKKDVAKSR